MPTQRYRDDILEVSSNNGHALYCHTNKHALRDHNYFTYITTNKSRAVLYTGMTNDLDSRILQHYAERGKSRTFAGRYHCYFLVYYEKHGDVEYAIEREKEIKGWRREKKERLISSFNPTWRFLNSDIMEWPPEEGVVPE